MVKLKELEDKAAKLEEIRSAKKALDKEEESIKADLKEFLGEQGTCTLGQFVIILSMRTRTDIDKDKVRAFMGDQYSDFEKKSEYQILEVKKA